MMIVVRMYLYSMGIESVVDKRSDKSSDGLNDAMCTACEMAVVWMENQLKMNQTEDKILSYVNEVNQHIIYRYI